MQKMDKNNKSGLSNTTFIPSPVIPAEAGISLCAKRLHFTKIPPDTSGSGMTIRKGDIYIDLTLL